MSAQQLQHSKYGFSKTVALPYEKTVEKACAALKEEGFVVFFGICLASDLAATTPAKAAA